MSANNRLAILILAAFLGCASSASFAEEAIVLKLALKGHHFMPAELTAPAGKSIEIEITNLDSTESEFESKTLRFEEVVAGNGKATIKVKALAPGRYRFYDDYYKETTQGWLVVH
jgi:hypothetical protein